MAYSYLKPKDIVELYKASKKYTESLTENFQEFERIARNKPHASIPKEYPKTTDGTTASIIRKTPHRVISQIPTGKVTSTTEDWLSIVAEFVYTNQIIPNANEGYALLQKCWTVIERFLTFGNCPTYVPFTEHNGYFCTDLRLIYWGDVFLQPGKLSDADSSYIFLRSWWQTKDIEALIDAQKKIDEKIRTWDIEALEKVKKLVVDKDAKAKTPHEREQQLNEQGGIELITGFQRGVGAKFYTFHVDSTGTGDKEVTEGTIVRTKVNKDPRGEMPVSFAYGDIDGSNPLGRSIVELVGSLQNLMDGEMQMFQYNRALQLNPPIIKRGNYSSTKLKFAPNAIWDLGSNANNSAETAKIDSTALANFPNNYGLMKSQLINLLASPDTSISAEVGNPGFSKTPAGVKQTQSNISVDDNYVRKQFETWFERWSETAINLYFAERTGIEELQLDEATVEKLEKLAEDGKFDMAMVSDDNKIRINYNTATPKLKFEVDASTSRKQDEIKQLESLATISDMLDKSPYLQQIVPSDKQLALWNALVTNSGVEDPEDLTIGENDRKEMEQKQAEMEQMQMQGDQPPEQAPPPDPTETTPDHVLKADQQTHKQELDMAKLQMEMEKQKHQEAMDKANLMITAEQKAQKPEQTKGKQEAK